MMWLIILTESEWQSVQRFLNSFSPLAGSPDAFFFFGAIVYIYLIFQRFTSGVFFHSFYFTKYFLEYNFNVELGIPVTWCMEFRLVSQFFVCLYRYIAHTKIGFCVFIYVDWFRISLSISLICLWDKFSSYPNLNK